eukprot:1886202-Prymnesium_polylepis.1
MLFSPPHAPPVKGGALWGLEHDPQVEVHGQPVPRVHVRGGGLGDAARGLHAQPHLHDLRADHDARARIPHRCVAGHGPHRELDPQRPAHGRWSVHM